MKTLEDLQKEAADAEVAANIAFSDCTTMSGQYFVQKIIEAATAKMAYNLALEVNEELNKKG